VGRLCPILYRDSRAKDAGFAFFCATYIPTTRTANEIATSSQQRRINADKIDNLTEAHRVFPPLRARTQRNHLYFLAGYKTVRDLPPYRCRSLLGNGNSATLIAIFKDIDFAPAESSNPVDPADDFDQRELNT